MVSFLLSSVSKSLIWNRSTPQHSYSPCGLPLSIQQPQNHPLSKNPVCLAAPSSWGSRSCSCSRWCRWGSAARRSATEQAPGPRCWSLRCASASPWETAPCSPSGPWTPSPVSDLGCRAATCFPDLWWGGGQFSLNWDSQDLKWTRSGFVSMTDRLRAGARCLRILHPENLPHRLTFLSMSSYLRIWSSPRNASCHGPCYRQHSIDKKSKWFNRLKF